MTIRLVDDWKKVMTYGSAQFALVGAAISAAGPALDAWYVVPDTLKKLLPSTVSMSMPIVIIFLAIIASRHFTTTPADASTTAAAK